jgi:hypothetical protein
MMNRVRVKPGTSDRVADLSGGRDTARDRRHPDDIARRAAQQTDARTYLARRYPGPEGDELADILGLAVEPERQPGMCACGAELSASDTGHGWRERRRRGMCAVCARAETGRPS